MALDPATFLGPAMDGCARGEHVWIWHRPPALWTTVLWGRPTEDDVHRMTSVWSLALRAEMPARFDSVVDCSRIAGADVAAFNALAGYMRAHGAAFRARLARQALVRPDGLIGSVVSGFFTVLGYAPTVQIFTGVAEAYAWLEGPAGAATAAEFARRFTAVESAPALLQALRTRLAADPAGVDLARVARALGTSSRSLQRLLAGAGTSFRAEVNAARVAAARERLAHTDQKIAVIAAGVGYRSAHQFARVFREVAGVTPQAWRDEHRARHG